MIGATVMNRGSWSSSESIGEHLGEMLASKESRWSCSGMREGALNVCSGSGSWAGREVRGLESESCVLAESLPGLVLLVRFAMREEAFGRA